MSHIHHSANRHNRHPSTLPHSIHYIRYDNKFEPLFVALLIFYDIQHRSAAPDLDMANVWMTAKVFHFPSSGRGVVFTEIIVKNERERTERHANRFSFRELRLPHDCRRSPICGHMAHVDRGNIFVRDFVHSKLRRVLRSHVLTNVRKHIFSWTPGRECCCLWVFVCRSAVRRKITTKIMTTMCNLRMRCLCRGMCVTGIATR